MRDIYNLYYNNPEKDGIIVNTIVKKAGKEDEFLQEIFDSIKDYINDINPDFKIYYYRVIEREKEITIDYGSHVNFFYAIKQ